ncbi:MAG: ADP-ribosylation factor-like protein [Candidatus Hodarchaeota archaeon]
MSEWVSESEVSSRLGYKILLAGLSEAGKTAVKRVFFLRQGTNDVGDLAATINYERLIVNIRETPITIVDLGGQRVFLKRFLGSFSPFIFSAVRAFLFLIDVENKATRNNAIEYFANCIEKLQTYSPNAEYFVFLHKNDLVRHLPNYESIHAQLKEQFQLESPKKITFFRTTIYTPESVVAGFGRLFELSMPQLAQSEYVDGRQIGQVEEYAEKFVTFRETPIARIPTPARSPELVRAPGSPAMAPLRSKIAATNSSAKTAGDPDTLTKLQSLMRTGVKVASSISETSPPTATPGDSMPVERLQELMKSSLKTESPAFVSPPRSISSAAHAETEKISQDVTLPPAEDRIVRETLTETPSTSEGLGEHHLDLLHSIDQAFDEVEIKEEAIEEPATPEEEKKSRIDFLIQFYGIEMSEATEVVETGYGDVFEIAATSRIPIPLILKVLLRYIPFIKSKNLPIETFDADKLLDILAAHLRGSIEENDILKALVIAAERIDMTIDEIVEKYFAKPTAKIRAMKPEKKPVVEEPLEPAPPVIPVEAADVPGMLTLPNSPNISFQVMLTPELNCRLSFYNQGELIGNALVSSTITQDEVMYLLHYEVQLPLEGGATAIYRAARTIHDAIKKLREEI